MSTEEARQPQNGSQEIQDTPRLSPQERRVLCEEIGSIGLTLGRALDSAAGTYALPLATAASRLDVASPLERLRLLRALWPTMQSALAAILRQPDVALRASVRLTRLAQTGGGPALAHHLARSVSGAAAWQKSRTLSTPRNFEIDPRVPESKPRPTEATLANRLAVTLLEEWHQEATTLAALADFCGEAEASEAARELATAARRWRGARLLADLKPLTARERASLTCAGGVAPAYTTLFTLWRALRSPLRFDWTKCPLFCAPSLEPWRLYEIWCFLKVCDALLALGWRPIEGSDAARCEPDGLRLSLTTGRASRLTFAPPASLPATATLQLFYQPLFVSANRDALRMVENGRDERTGFCSRSHAMQPDIALLWRDSLTLLDPKFRAYDAPGAEQDDINKMHAYRDAILPRATGAEGVRAAWCLFPGEPGGEEGSCAMPLAVAVRAYPSATPERPFGTAGIGALRLRPAATGATYLAKLVETWLREPSEET